MKLLLSSLACLLSVAAVSAQVHHGAAPPFTSVGGWGSVAFPGVGHPPAGGYVNPGHRFNSVNVLGPSRFNRPNRPVYTYAYPVYVGSSAYDPGYGPPDPGYAAAPPPPAAPTVIINQNFAAPAPPAEPVETVHVYGTARPAEALPEPQYYLIALKDHSVYSAVAYWVEDGTLHYITTPNIRNETSLDRVDMALTARLNQERGVSVSLPPAR